MLAVVWLVICCLFLVPAAQAVRNRPTTADSEELRRKMIAEAREVSRRQSPPNAGDLVSKVGIEVQPIDTSKSVPFTKREIADQLSSIGAAPPPCPYVPNGNLRVGSVTKAFAEVAWHFCFRDMGLKGLWIGPVQIKRTPTSAWTQVIYQAGLAEVFVPYHDRPEERPYDMQFCPIGGCQLQVLNSQDMGPTGNLVTLTGQSLPSVVTEVRDRGVAWLCKQVSHASRRGQELLVWGVQEGSNYDNITQFGFRDDGMMTFRIGTSGFTMTAHDREDHTHNALWRVDMDLNGATGDSALHWDHREPKTTNQPLLAQDSHPPFDSNTEGGVLSLPQRVTSVLIEDNATNGFGAKIGYDFHLAQAQTSRHFGPLDDWTKRDFWVTRYQNGQGWVNNHQPPDNYVVGQASDNQSVTNTDTVVWVKSSAHHEPKDEDRAASDISNPALTSGVTLAHWSGFDVEPRNLFDANPMGGPSRCQ
jgi:primary-amine oxidase